MWMPVEKATKTNRFLREKVLLDNLKIGMSFPLRGLKEKTCLQVLALPVRDKDVFLVFSRKSQTFAFVSGKNFSEVKKRLQEESGDPESWEGLKTFLTIIPAALFDAVGALNTDSIDYERHFINHT